MPARLYYSTTLAKLKELADDLPKAMRTTVEKMLSEQMDAEVSAQIGASHQERSSDRSSHRNGYRERALETQLGKLNNRIPKLREGSYFPSFAGASLPSPCESVRDCDGGLSGRHQHS